MLWITGYFTIGVWWSIWMMIGPRIASGGDNLALVQGTSLTDLSDDDLALAPTEVINNEIDSLQDRLGRLQAEVMRRLVVSESRGLP